MLNKVVRFRYAIACILWLLFTASLTISGRIRKNESQWMEWRKPSYVESGMPVWAASIPSGGRSFSATMVLEDLYSSREGKGDFLSIHLSKHFPNNYTEEDRRQLLNRIHEIGNGSLTRPQRFRRGMLYFFLALSESRQFAASKASLSAEQISGYWKASQEDFLASPETGAWMAEELNRLFEQYDGNQDGVFQPEELKQLMSRAARQK